MIIMTCQTGHYAKKVSICVHNAVVLKMVLLQNKTREKEEIEKRPQIDTSNTKAFHWDFQYAWQSLSDNIEWSMLWWRYGYIWRWILGVSWSWYKRNSDIFPRVRKNYCKKKVVIKPLRLPNTAIHPWPANWSFRNLFCQKIRDIWVYHCACSWAPVRRRSKESYKTFWRTNLRQHTETICIVQAHYYRRHCNKSEWKCHQPNCEWLDAEEAKYRGKNFIYYSLPFCISRIPKVPSYGIRTRYIGVQRKYSISPKPDSCVW